MPFYKYISLPLLPAAPIHDLLTHRFCGRSAGKGLRKRETRTQVLLGPTLIPTPPCTQHWSLLPCKTGLKLRSESERSKISHILGQCLQFPLLKVTPLTSLFVLVLVVTHTQINTYLFILGYKSSFNYRQQAFELLFFYGYFILLTHTQTHKTETAAEFTGYSRAWPSGPSAITLTRPTYLSLEPECVNGWPPCEQGAGYQHPMTRSSSLSGLLEPIPRSEGLSGRWSRADPMVALESFAVPSSPKWQTSGPRGLVQF